MRLGRFQEHAFMSANPAAASAALMTRGVPNAAPTSSMRTPNMEAASSKATSLSGTLGTRWTLKHSLPRSACCRAVSTGHFDTTAQWLRKSHRRSNSTPNMAASHSLHASVIPTA